MSDRWFVTSWAVAGLMVTTGLYWTTFWFARNPPYDGLAAYALVAGGMAGDLAAIATFALLCGAVRAWFWRMRTCIQR